jgi:hypothetical protein
MKRNVFSSLFERSIPRNACIHYFCKAPQLHRPLPFEIIMKCATQRRTCGAALPLLWCVLLLFVSSAKGVLRWKSSRTLLVPSHTTLSAMPVLRITAVPFRTVSIEIHVENLTIPIVARAPQPPVRGAGTTTALVRAAQPYLRPHCRPFAPKLVARHTRTPA